MTDPAGDIELPLDAYSLSEADVDQLQLAAFIEMGHCVQGAGFSFNQTELVTYWKHYEAVDIGDVGLHQNLRRYGVTLASQATKDGYHVPSDVDAKPNQPVYTLKTEIPGFGKFSAAERVVLLGKGNVSGKADQSCSAQAYNKINGTSPGQDLAGQLASESYGRSRTAAPVVAAFKQWSTCMASRGYHYPDPTKAGNGLDLDGPTVSAQERAIAQADVACKDKVNLIPIWSGWESTYQKQQIDKNSQALQQEKNEHDQQLRRAAAAIGSGH